MFNSTLVDFDLRLLQGAQQDSNPCSNIFYDESAYYNATLSNNTLDELQMEEDEIGLLESSSDLQAFMNMASLPEVKPGDEDIDVEKVITDMTDFLQNYDNVDNQVVPNDVNNAVNEDSKNETAAAVDILDELLKA